MSMNWTTMMEMTLMRDILFRGKRIDNGEWVLSGNIIRFIPENGEDLIFIPALSEPCTCYHDEKDNIIAFEKGIFYKVDTKTVGQYTGLLDKNGKKVFEGDIVRKTNEGRHPQIFTANIRTIFRENEEVYYSPCDHFTESCEYEIIGNIHDNSELLEV